VVGADELVGMLGVRQVSELDDRAALFGHRYLSAEQRQKTAVWQF
jgi:hypothetical protein